MRWSIRIDHCGTGSSSPKALKLMELSATGSQLTEFQVEYAIAAVHANAFLVERAGERTVAARLREDGRLSGEFLECSRAA